MLRSRSGKVIYKVSNTYIRYEMFSMIELHFFNHAAWVTFRAAHQSPGDRMSLPTEVEQSRALCVLDEPLRLRLLRDLPHGTRHGDATPLLYRAGPQYLQGVCLAGRREAAMGGGG